MPRLTQETRDRNQWQSGGDRQRTWSSQENQGNRSKLGYSRSYDKWDRDENTENRTYRNTTGSNRDAEVKKIDRKQDEFSENSQHLRPAAVAKGGYTKIMVNPIQLEDEAFTAWVQRLTEARRKTEKTEFRDHTETFVSHTMIDMSLRKNLVKTDTESTKLSRNSNL